MNEAPGGLHSSLESGGIDNRSTGIRGLDERLGGGLPAEMVAAFEIARVCAKSALIFPVALFVYTYALVALPFHVLLALFRSLTGVVMVEEEAVEVMATATAPTAPRARRRSSTKLRNGHHGYETEHVNCGNYSGRISLLRAA